MKVVFVLSQHYINNRGFLKNSFHGIGDVVNGIAYCIEYCRHNNLQFKIAVEKGSNYEKFFDFGIYAYGLTTEIPFFIEDLSVIDFNSDIFIFTNGSASFELSNCSLDTKESIKKIFFPKRQNEKLIFSNILHIRSGDHAFVDKSVLDRFYTSDYSHPFSPYDLHSILSVEERANCILNYLTSNNLEEKFDFIISDDSVLKKKISNMAGLHSNDIEVAHFGVYQSDLKSLIATLDEFQLIFNSKYILSISSFPYGIRKSNFVYVPACIGNISAKYASLNIFEKKVVDI